MIAPQSVSMVAGGPAVQALRTAAHLPAQGVEVAWFDQWRRYEPEEFDLYHIFGASLITYDIARRLKEYGRPFVVSSIFFTMRSPGFIRFARNVERVGKRIYSGIWTDYGITADVCSMAEGVLPNTTSEARIVVEGFEIPRERVHVVPNGVDARFADADPAPFIERYGMEEFVLNVGHIGSRRKNLLALVEALEEIDAPAVIIGQIQRNAYGERILERARRNPRLNIIEGLRHDDPLLASAYAAAKVFALPSLFETPGIAALEAALAGANIAITKHGGTRDYFADLADYCEPTSVASIRDAIRSALERPRGGELRGRIRERFLWERVAEMTAEVYRGVVG